MAFQTVFKRYELKYMITREQKDRILRAMEPYMVQDRFGRSTIRNIYFDTDDFILARHSIAKPDFKEKLRIRSYAAASPDSTVFVELKRKFDHVVYKRRVALPENFAMKWAQGFAGRLSSSGTAPAGTAGSITASATGSNGARILRSTTSLTITAPSGRPSSSHTTDWLTGCAIFRQPAPSLIYTGMEPAPAHQCRQYRPLPTSA